MSNYYYNKEIEIGTYSSTKDSHGIYRNKWTKVTEGLPNPLLVDVQPFSMQKAKVIYGYDVECTKRIFIDIYEALTESSTIKYKNKYYKVQKIIDWDDYLAVLVIERTDIKIEKF